jgi:hypothetical protein
MAYKINYLNKTKIQQKLMDIQIIERVLNP